MPRILLFIISAVFWSLTAWANVNVNTASESELTSLPGIGPAKAAAIIQHRSQNGPFKSLSDLDAVSGIGPATLANITPLVVFSKDGKPPAAKAAVNAPEGESTGSTEGAININTAAASDLQSLPGIGPSKADAIVADRKANGPFSACSDLQRVRGVGPATIAGITTQCTTK